MGMVLLPLGLLVLGLYLWVATKGTRWAYRKYALPGAIGGIAFFVLLPTWDIILNRLYVGQVLCNQAAVGLQILGKVTIPPNAFGDKKNAGLSELLADQKRPFLGKYAFEIRYEDKGVYPVTANRHFTYGVIDVSTNAFLSKLEDYQSRGGWLWTNVFRLVLNSQDYSWIASRGSSESCFERHEYWRLITDAKAKPFE